VSHGFDFDQIVASGNGFSVSMNGVGHSLAANTLSNGSRTHFTQTLPTIKRSEARKRVHIVDVAEISNAIVEKNFRRSIAQQEMHQASTVFPQRLTGCGRRRTLETHE
jgi:hypothetical protein